MAKRAIIAGASGLVGGKLLNILLQQPEYDQVFAIVRKKLPVDHPRLEQMIVNFNDPQSFEKAIYGDALFSCLGSTRQKTPNKIDYRKVDHGYPLQLADIALKNKVGSFHLVSSMGADPLSPFFYTRLKGEIENDITKVNVPCLQIYRPSALTGDRSESRFAERVFFSVMKLINPLLLGNLKKYRTISAQTVAMAMYKQSLKKEEGVFIFSSDQIKNLA